MKFDQIKWNRRQLSIVSKYPNSIHREMSTSSVTNLVQVSGIEECYIGNIHMMLQESEM